MGVTALEIITQVMPDMTDEELREIKEFADNLLGAANDTTKIPSSGSAPDDMPLGDIPGPSADPDYLLKLRGLLDILSTAGASLLSRPKKKP